MAESTQHKLDRVRPPRVQITYDVEIGDAIALTPPMGWNGWNSWEQLIDREKVIALGVPINDVFDALQSTMGALYVNDFNKFGRTYSVYVQADAPFRARADDIGQLKVRSDSGEMIPLSALMKVDSSFGPERAMRYNGFLSADLNGAPAPGYSTGQAQDAVARVAIGEAGRLQSGSEGFLFLHERCDLLMVALPRARALQHAERRRDGAAPVAHRNTDPLGTEIEAQRSHRCVMPAPRPPRVRSPPFEPCGRSRLWPCCRPSTWGSRGRRAAS